MGLTNEALNRKIHPSLLRINHSLSIPWRLFESIRYVLNLQNEIYLVRCDLERGKGAFSSFRRL